MDLLSVFLFTFVNQYRHFTKYFFFQAFIELERLTKDGEEMEWKETARWIKFEENVEESNRWGKPHVASLTFHSLLELRKGLEKGTFICHLDLF